MATASGGKEEQKVADFDELVDEIIARKGPAKYQDGLSENNWEEELEQIPLFMTKPPTSEVEAEAAPALAALQDLIYQEDTPHGRAMAHKEDGNEHFKKKRYREAIEAYSEGLRQELSESQADRQLRAVLLCNRATSHYYLGNFRSGLTDAEKAHKVTPDYMKAVVRAAECCVKLKRFEEALKWCDSGLALDKAQPVLKPLRSKAITEKKKQERDQRKELAAMKAKCKRDQELIQTIKSRGVTVGDGEEDGEGLQEIDLTCPHPSGERVHLTPDGTLVWPVLFLYPEFGETDLIQEFRESDRFIDHLREVFSQPPPWDQHCHYTLPALRVYYSDSHFEGVWAVDVHETLGSILMQKSCVVHSGTPVFIILSSLSSHMSNFLQRHKLNVS